MSLNIAYAKFSDQQLYAKMLPELLLHQHPIYFENFYMFADSIKISYKQYFPFARMGINPSAFLKLEKTHVF